MSKDKTGSEPNFDTVLERVNVDSKALLIKTPFDNLKIKKNLDQLYHILKKKNEDEKTVPEELRARNIFRLSQLGIECSKISQALIHEQYFINKKKEEKETQSTSQFATTLGEDYDVNSYIQKYTDFMLFNLTDHAYIQGKNRTQKQVVTKLSELWANDVKKLVESKGVKSDSLSVGARILSQGPRATIKRKSKGIDDKKAKYFNSLNKYMSLKYTQKERSGGLVSNMISEFGTFTRGDQEVCELWKILGYQVDAFEKASLETQTTNDNVLGGASFDDDGVDGKKSLSYCYRCYLELIQVTCKVLEEEFLTQIITQNRGTTSYVQHHDVGGVSEEDRTFIIQEYMDPSFRNRNYIEFDDKSYPVWAMCYVLFRTGRLDQLQKFLSRYEGSLKGELTRFNQFLTKYRNTRGELDSDSRQDVLQSLDSGEQNIDVFKKMLYFILAKSEDIPSEDLVARLGDYLWFNLKICSPIQEDLTNRKGLKIHSHSLSLLDIQQRILSYRPEHFNPGNSVPLNYVKTLFILQAYDEALLFLRNYETYYEEFIHFAIALYESGLVTLRWSYMELNPKFKFTLFKDNDYCREVTEYATSFCEKNPLEACLYLRLLWPDKDSSPENAKNKKRIIETISNFIISNDQVSMFFDKTREAQKNAGYLEDIVGSELYREVILAITNHYRKSKLQVALVLLDKIEYHENVLELILEEEYESLKKFKERSKGRDLTTAKSPYESFFNEILDRYGRKNILNKHRLVYTAYEFLRRVKTLWENYARKNYNEAFEYLRKWDHEWYIFGYNENEILEEFTANHEIVQKCYLDLLLVSSRIIKEYTNYLRHAQKSQEHINTKLREANILWRKLCDFYRKVKRKFSADPKNTQTLKELDNEIEIISTF